MYLYIVNIEQRCIVHMIKNSVRFVYYKDLKPFCNDLKTIYIAKNEKLGYEQLQKVKEKWKDKYPTSLRNWEDNWDAICPFFSYSEPLRKIMYTTNTIESLMKCLYLATQNITKKWTTRYGNWDMILSKLSIMFDGRI